VRINIKINVKGKTISEEGACEIKLVMDPQVPQNKTFLGQMKKCEVSS
jgi:hypothetical protein